MVTVCGLPKKLQWCYFCKHAEMNVSSINCNWSEVFQPDSLQVVELLGQLTAVGAVVHHVPDDLDGAEQKLMGRIMVHHSTAQLLCCIGAYHLVAVACCIGDKK